MYLLDGNAYFSQPGPRLVDSLEILAHTLLSASIRYHQGTGCRKSAFVKPKAFLSWQ